MKDDDKPYLTLVHDTNGSSTDRTIDEVKNEIKEIVQSNIDDDPNFVPHLWRKVERDIPTQIAALALIGAEKILKISISHSIPKRTLPLLMRKDYFSSGGKVPFFGKITGYYLHQRLGRSFEFDTEGTLLAIHPNSPPHYGEKATIEFE